MFFIFSVYDKEKKIDYESNLVVHDCGKFGKFELFKRFTTLSLFFIPTIRWNTRYFIVFNCCGSVYELDKEIGKRIEKGENIDITNHITLLSEGASYCPNCGQAITGSYTYCPHCGKLL